MKHFKLMKGVLACLLSLALVFSCFSAVGAQAAETTTTTVALPTASSDVTYNPEKDTLVSSTGKVVYVLSKESGNTIKAGAKCYEMSTKADENTLTAMGVKGTNKDAYFYVCDKQFEAEGTNIKANFVVKAQAAKKIVANIDYTQADDPESTTVLSITATDSAKKKIEGATCIWSEDGTTWKAANEFKGANLIKMLEAGGSIQVKMLGTTSNGNVRTSKAIKVKIAKQGKAPTLKIDVKKDTFSIKNGMDFAIFTKTGETYNNISGWRTVLPNLKTAKIKTVEDSIVATSGEYLPLDKKDTAATNDVKANKVSYTQAKVKAIGYKTIDALVSASSGSITTGTKVYLGVRSSATSKKPASSVTYVEYTAKTEAPIVYTESCVDGQYLVSSGKEFAKKGFTLSTIANYNGADGTTGYDDSFELKKNQTDADTNPASYEYTIVKKSDLGDLAGSGETIDWTSVAWKKLDPAKTKINGKLKSKYVNTSGQKVTAELKAGSISGAATEAVPEDVSTLMLVRRAGVKGSVLASEYQILYVAKNGSDFGIYSTKSVGEEAAPYTVKFYRYSVSGEGTTNYTWKEDESLTITGWGGGSGATTEYVSFPSVEKADFFKLENSSVSGSKVTAEANGTQYAGKYAIAVPAGSGAQVYEFAIREYANIKVVGVASDSGETVGTAKTLGSVKDGKVNAGNDIIAYADGSVITISLSGESTIVPTGYVAETGKTIVVSAASGEGFKDFEYTAATDSASGKVTVKVNKADEIEVKLVQPVVKEYTITYDLNKPSDLTLDTGVVAPLATKTNGAKTTTLAGTTNLTGTKAATADGGEATSWHVTGWYKEAGCTNKVENSTVFTSDTTVYAKWEAAT